MCDGFEEEQLASSLDKFKEVVCEKTGETSSSEMETPHVEEGTHVTSQGAYRIPIGSRRELNLRLIPF